MVSLCASTILCREEASSREVARLSCAEASLDAISALNPTRLVAGGRCRERGGGERELRQDSRTWGHTHLVARKPPGTKATSK